MNAHRSDIRTARRAGVALLATTALAAAAATALAHTKVVASSPASGSTAKTTISRATVTFLNRLDRGTLRVVGPGGRTVSAGRGALDPRNPRRVVVRLRRPLRPGGYRAHWRVEITNDHPQRGSFSFRLRR